MIALASVLVIFAAFAAGMGLYAAVLALWPLVLVWWPWLLAGAVAVVALGAWWLWWRLPKWQVDRLRLTIRDPKARADVEDNFRKTVGQLLGGAAVLIGAAFAYLQFTQQQQSSRDLLISNQVAKGFELLGNKDNQIQQRLGGIYALEGVMNTSKQYHQPVLEALCAFVRESAKTEGPPTDDIQAALTVIGRRKSGFEELPLNLEAAIPKAYLVNANLSGAFLDDAILNDAILVNADLSGADLSNAKLNSAKLQIAKLNGANLSGTDLSGADLTIADLSDANLSGADLGGAKITQAQLDKACGTDVKLDPGLTIKPCQPQ
jgi:uncharacterized protein YjbI with pentapeptide repeats